MLMNDVVLLRVLTLPLHVNSLPHLQKNPQRNSRNKLHQLKAVYLKLMDAYTYIFKSVVTHELNPLHQSQSKSNCKINCSVCCCITSVYSSQHVYCMPHLHSSSVISLSLQCRGNSVFAFSVAPDIFSYFLSHKFHSNASCSLLCCLMLRKLCECCILNFNTLMQKTDILWFIIQGDCTPLQPLLEGFQDRRRIYLTVRYCFSQINISGLSD